MAEIKAWLTDTAVKLKKDKKAFFTVVIGVLGMLLVLLSELPGMSPEEKQEAEDDISYISESIEKDTERMISKIRGAGKVSVMLTYESSEERIWAKDSEVKTQSQEHSSESSKHIIIDTADGETGLAVKVRYPRVRGVAVVCSGGDDPAVRSEIKALVSALFDIGSNRISIAPRAAEE